MAFELNDDTKKDFLSSHYADRNVAMRLTYNRAAAENVDNQTRSQWF